MSQIQLQIDYFQKESDQNKVAFEDMTSKYNAIQNLVKNLENDKSEHLVEIEKLKYQLRQAEDEIAQIV